MTIGELNHLMTYVTEGWMLFSIGFISIGFVSFVSRRIQEDIEADRLALKAAEANEVSLTEAVEGEVSQGLSQAESAAIEVSVSPVPKAAKASLEDSTQADLKQEDSTQEDSVQEDSVQEDLTQEDEARLEEVAAVSEQLAKTKNKQSDTSSVSVST